MSEHDDLEERFVPRAELVKWFSAFKNEMRLLIFAAVVVVKSDIHVPDGLALGGLVAAGVLKAFITR